MNRTKTVLFEKDASNPLVEGINTLANAVTTTFGASGGTVILQDMYGNASVTKDGVSVARGIEFKDNSKNIGCRIVREAAEKTLDDCGDGTTTTVLLSQELINQGLAMLERGDYNVFEMKKGVEEASSKVIELLEKTSVPVTNEKLKDIATISANNDEELGELISQAFIDAGENGTVVIEDSISEKTYTTSVEGLEVERGFSNKHFITDKEKEKAELDNPLILLVDQKIDNIEQISFYLEHAIIKKRPILIVGEIDVDVMATLVLNKIKAGMAICAISPPHFGWKRKDLMQDIAISTGATVIDESVGDNFENLDLSFLGEAKKVVIDKSYTKILTKKENSDSVEQQIRVLKSVREEQEEDDQKEFIDTRIAKLAGKVQIIHVGGQTDVERKEKKDRVDDAVRATKCSLEEGISAGGGISLFDISFDYLIEKRKNPSFNAGVVLIKEVLKAPLKKILENAGEDYSEIGSEITNNGSNGYGYNVKTKEYGNMIDMGIIDPTKVIKHSLINSISVAMSILTTKCIVVNEN